MNIDQEIKLYLENRVFSKITTKKQRFNIKN